MTFVWFIVWLIANNVGGGEPLQLDPVNIWTASLILAVALDLNRPRPGLAQGRRGAGGTRSREVAP